MSTQVLFWIWSLKKFCFVFTEFYRSTLQMTKDKIDRMVEKQKSQKKEWATEVCVYVFMHAQKCIFLLLYLVAFATRLKKYKLEHFQVNYRMLNE